MKRIKTCMDCGKNVMDAGSYCPCCGARPFRGLAEPDVILNPAKWECEHDVARRGGFFTTLAVAEAWPKAVEEYEAAMSGNQDMMMGVLSDEPT